MSSELEVARMGKGIMNEARNCWSNVAEDLAGEPRVCRPLIEFHAVKFVVQDSVGLPPRYAYILLSPSSFYHRYHSLFVNFIAEHNSGKIIGVMTLRCSPTQPINANITVHPFLSPKTLMPSTSKIPSQSSVPSLLPSRLKKPTHPSLFLLIFPSLFSPHSSASLSRH